MDYYNGTKQAFYPCTVDSTFCTVYLQAELQGLADRLESNSGHPSYINLLGRVCLGTQDVCSYYQNHFWYSNLTVKSYDRTLQQVQMKHNLAVNALSHTLT
jgi:hypothetical protein